VAAKRTTAEKRKLDELLTRDHTLNGAILFGLDGHVVEMEARAMEVLREPRSLANATKISGVARDGVKESLDRIAGALAKLQLAESDVIYGSFEYVPASLLIGRHLSNYYIPTIQDCFDEHNYSSCRNRSPRIA
jgi:hypothetical protein